MKKVIQKKRGQESGQAMIELAFMSFFFFAFMIGTFEISVVYLNTSIIKEATKEAVYAAALGAQDPTIEKLVFNKLSGQMMFSTFANYKIGQMKIGVWAQGDGGSRGETHLAPPGSGSALNWNLTPNESGRAEYLSRAQGSYIGVTIPMRVGIVVPFMSALVSTSKEFVIGSWMRIQANNDEDHNGMVDLYEPELFLMNPVPPAPYSFPGWVSISHTDTKLEPFGGGVSDYDTVDIDYDSLVDRPTYYIADSEQDLSIGRYDFDNDGREDKYDGANPYMVRSYYVNLIKGIVP